MWHFIASNWEVLCASGLAVGVWEVAKAAWRKKRTGWTSTPKQTANDLARISKEANEEWNRDKTPKHKPPL